MQPRVDSQSTARVCRLYLNLPKVSERAFRLSKGYLETSIMTAVWVGDRRDLSGLAWSRIAPSDCVFVRLSALTRRTAGRRKRVFQVHALSHRPVLNGAGQFRVD